MTRIAQIDDRCAALTWSPISTHADIIAIGTKDSGGVGFDDNGGELEFFNYNSPQVIGAIKTTCRFSSIGWTSYTASQLFPSGLIGGGMADGSVMIWDPSPLLGTRERENVSLVASIKQHKGGAVTALKFNSQMDTDEAKLFATGGSDGQVLITSLARPDTPETHFSSLDGGGSISDISNSRAGMITNLCWNSQVSHIVASASGAGIVAVWDIRQKKKWCEIRCEHSGVPVSDLAWNPTEGLHMVTACSDDRFPVIKLWDLRASTSVPLATLEGHTAGVLSLDWCPHDTTLLLSSGNDCKTFIWDLCTLKPIHEITYGDNDNNNTSNGHQNDEYQQQTSTSMYGGNLDSSITHQRRYDARWSPIRRGVVSTCSFDRKVQTHSVLGAGAKSGRAPAWFKRASGVSTAFGGKLVTFGSPTTVVNVESVEEHPGFSKLSQEFEQAVSSQNYTGYCSEKAQEAFRDENVYETQVWGFMQIMFEENARVHILKYLGFDPIEISTQAAAFDGESMKDSDTCLRAMPKKAQKVVHKALLVGDFEAAVDCCFRVGNYADALVLSSCGGPELWAKTQGEYFAREAEKRPYLSVVSAVIHNQLDELVQSTEPEKWQETLAILSTYAKAEEFPNLCLTLGSKLEEVRKSAEASLCYMCALDINRAAEYWRSQYNAEITENESDNLSSLHKYIEKVSIFMQAPEVSRDNLSPEISHLFTVYAKALAEQGLLETAAKYCFSNSQPCMELRDQLYRSAKTQECRQIIGAVPTFPFHVVNVGVAPKRSAAETVAINKRQQQQHYQPQQQQQQYAPHQTSPTTTSSSDALPLGWVALQDPASGRTYYANQSTGESSWERPIVVEQQVKPQLSQPGMSYGSQSDIYQQQYAGQQSIAPAANYQPSQPVSYQQPTAEQFRPNQQAQHAEPMPNGSVSITGVTPQKVASKYGDGFVSSSSHPELGEQYGNIGTSNPYATTEGRPGIAKVSGAPYKAPISATLDVAISNKLPINYQPIAEDLISFLGMLAACPLSPSEKKQLSEIERGIAIFTKKMAREDVDPAVIDSVNSMLVAIKERQYAAAQAIQTKLVNTEWTQHKDWLKGMKFLILLIMKRL